MSLNVYIYITISHASIHVVTGKLCLMLLRLMPTGSLMLQVLAGCIRSVLIDIPRIEEMVGEKLPDEIREVFIMLADCAYHILTSASYGKLYAGS